MLSRRFQTLLAIALLATPPLAAQAKLPPEGRCPDFTGTPSEDGQIDSGAPLVKEGAVLNLQDLLNLRQLLPDEVWAHRDAFLHEGMRMTIGFCHRRYPNSEFYDQATRISQAARRSMRRATSRITSPGSPSPTRPSTPKPPDAAIRWAWNFENRYRGAGPVGSFKIMDLPDRIGGIQNYEGEWHYIRTAHRSDLIASEYTVPESTKTLWVAGGKFEEPTNARHLAWRQSRPREAAEKFDEPDDTFVYLPDMRKPRRATSIWTDGLFTPRYTVSGVEGVGGAAPFAVDGGTEYTGPSFVGVSPSAGLLIAATEDIRKGFTGLALRPNAYEWTLLGEREVLAPLNGSADGWPSQKDRNFGPTGLSVATDRWDVRYAVVIRGRARNPIQGVGAITLWIDVQTQQPLYFISQRPNGFLLDVGILVHRYSGDRAGYPAWPGGERARVFDPVAASFYYVPGGGAGWRRESYDVKSVPIEPAKLRKLTSHDELVKGR